jgi:hypothetical protein
MSIDNLIQKIYLDLFQDDATKTILGITFLELDLNKLKEQAVILEFSDWANLSEIRKYDKDWISEFTLDLLKRSIVDMERKRIPFIISLNKLFIIHQ